MIIILPRAALRLRMRGAGLRLHVRPNAFGNALGSSIASTDWRSSDGQQVDQLNAAASTQANLAMSRYNAREQRSLDNLLSPDFDLDAVTNAPASLGSTFEGDMRNRQMVNEVFAQFRSSVSMAEIAAVSVNSQLRNGSNGNDYDTFKYGSRDDGMQFIEHTRHAGSMMNADRSLAGVQAWLDERAQSVENSGVEFAADGNVVGAGFQALMYTPSKTASLGLGGIVGLGRLGVSQDMAPNTVRSLSNPTQLIGDAVKTWNGASLQDRTAFGLSMALPFAPALARSAGRLPVAGEFLAGDLGYSAANGVTLSAGGKQYGFIGPGIDNVKVGPYAYQQGAVGGIRFGEITSGVNTSFDVTRVTTKDIPSFKSGGFNEWFDARTPGEISTMYAQPSLRNKIESGLRGAGGNHEMLMVAEAPQWKHWGVDANMVQKDFAIAISDLNERGLANGWKHSTGLEGSSAPLSKTVHNQLQDIIQKSTSLTDFKTNVRPWADKWITGGYGALPPGFHN